MDDLRKRLDSEIITAAKSKDKLKLSTLRMVKSSIKYKEIETKSELSGADIIQVLSSMVKQRNDSFKAFTDANRDDLASKEKAEIDILKEFLPPQLSADEIKAKAKEVIEQIGAKGASDIGNVMKAIMPLLAGKAQGKEVNLIVRDILTSN